MIRPDGRPQVHNSRERRLSVRPGVETKPTDQQEIDPMCRDLAAFYLGKAYDKWPPSQEEADADLRTLSLQIQATIDDWFFAKFDGERG